jgi:drug/metabolite transporter (DMT)-like permease
VRLTEGRSSSERADSRRERYPVAGVLNLLVLYVIWGSTYLAIRLAVRDGAGWGPFWLGATRVFVASAVLFLINWLRGVRLRPSREELWVLAVSGVLLWVGGNGGVNWAEQKMDSGLAALVIGSLPIWVALMEAILDRRRPSLLLVASLVAGFAGLVVLIAPSMGEGLGGDVLGVLVVLAGTICWGIGSILLNRRPVQLDPIVTSGWQQLLGGLGFTAFALLLREPAPNPTPQAWMAWAYLVAFGSLIAFTSFVVVVKLLPPTVAMTYSYVNPVIAIILGWMILSEPLSWTIVFAAVLIIAGVWGVFRDQAPGDGGERE